MRIRPPAELRTWRPAVWRRRSNGGLSAHSPVAGSTCDTLRSLCLLAKASVRHSGKLPRAGRAFHLGVGLYAREDDARALLAIGGHRLVIALDNQVVHANF